MKMDRCYLCGSSDAHEIHKGVRGGNANILQCNHCGLVRLSETLDDIDGFYRASGMRDGNISETLGQARRETRADDARRFRFTEKMIEGKDILDFGCGNGGYLKHAMAMARKAEGVELENAFRKQLLEEGVVCHERIESAGSFDVILMFHVLEHLVDPVEALREMQAHLKDDGQIIIEVPNADDALLSLYQSEAFADFTYWICHIYLYTRKTLSMLAERAGMKIRFMKQVQRYSLANHLHWLSKGKPGGHYAWSFLEDSDLDERYGQMLANLGIADTIIASFAKA